jgi:hypothetical protein
VLLLLIGVGTGLGAVLGAAGSPGTAGSSAPAGVAAQRWVHGVLAATKAAGTAHLRYTAITTSADPTLRGSTAGSGVVDFRAGTFSVNEVLHQNDWTVGPGATIDAHAETVAQSMIAVGPTLYLSLGPAGITRWAKESNLRDETALGLGSALNFAGALSWLAPPFTVRSVSELRASTLDGVPATRYLVQSAWQTVCPRGTKLPRTPLFTTTLWVDSAGRLVQARNSVYSSGQIPAAVVKKNPVLAVRPKGSTTQHNTLRLSAFGQPAPVTPPAATAGAAFGTAVSLRARCS